MVITNRTVLGLGADTFDNDPADTDSRVTDVSDSVIAMVPPKAISNGHPMAAIIGRRRVMDAAQTSFISSTYWSDPLGMVASLTTIRELRRRNVSESLWSFGRELQSRLNAVAEEVGLDVHCGGLAVHPHLEFASASPDQKPVLATLFIQEMAKRGCHGYASFYLNAAQGAAELEQTAAAAREVFTIIRRAIDSRNPESFLECPRQQDAFRRLVR